MAAENSSLPQFIRPTLPSLHTLDLPNPVLFKPIELPQCYDVKITTHNDMPVWHRSRQSSISSTTSSCIESSARSASPIESTPIPFNRAAASPPAVYRPSGSFSLVRSTMQEANAFVVVPSSQEPYVESISALSRSSSSTSQNARRNQALLLVGPAVEYLRHPKVRIAKGARVHPYRVVPNHTRRQPSTLTPRHTS